MTQLNIIAIPGSLRAASTTKQLVNALQALAPQNVTISVYELADIPMYNQDVEDQGFPQSVIELREAVAAADGIIFATPEYNGAMTGVIKNAIDWLSRKGLMAQRPVTTITGSPGALGATKAQESLRAVLSHLGMYVMSRPSLAIPAYHQKIADNVITDEMTQKFVTEWLIAFEAWIVQLNK